jgi:hypothetical protein
MGLQVKPNRVPTEHDVFEVVSDELAARAIATSEGVLAFADEAEPVTDLAISRETASRFFSLAEGLHGNYYITGFDLHEVVASRPVALTIPAFIDGHPVTHLIDTRFDTPESRSVETIKAKPLRAPLALLTLPETLESVGRGVMAILLPFTTRIPATLCEISLAGLAGQAAYLNAPFATDTEDPAPRRSA